MGNVMGNAASKVGDKWATQASEIGRNEASRLEDESVDLQAEVSVALGSSGL
jgi:hypothetical protein